MGFHHVSIRLFLLLGRELTDVSHFIFSGGNMLWILLAIGAVIGVVYLVVKYFEGSGGTAVMALLVAGVVFLIGAAGVDSTGPHDIVVEKTIAVAPISFDVFQFTLGVDVGLHNYYIKDENGNVLKLAANKLQIDSPRDKMMYFKRTERNHFGFWYLGIWTNESRILTLPDYRLVKFQVTDE